jgi:hypothetical protein
MIEIRPLRPDDDRQAFSSGDADLDRFFRKYAGQNQFRLPDDFAAGIDPARVTTFPIG